MNITINGGTNSFEGITGLEQEIIDALREQAERCAKLTYPRYLQDHSAIRPYPGEPISIEDHVAINWFSHLTPKASAMIGKMKKLINAEK